MKKLFEIRFLNFFSFLVFMVLSMNGNCQDSAYKHPLPFMWSGDGSSYVRNFETTKLPRLNSPTIEHPTGFYLGNFLGMIEYFVNTYTNFACLHVYIGVFSPEGSSRVPGGEGNKLTLIFAPASAYVNSTTKTDIAYFIIPPDSKGFNVKDSNQFKIDETLARKWIGNYTNNVMKSILNTINNTDNDNKIDGKISDTRCITYCKGDLVELLKELEYIHTNESNSSVIALSKTMHASFAAFGNGGNPRNHNKNKYRLFVQFNFMNEDDRSDVDFQKMYKFSERGKPSDISKCINACVPEKKRIKRLKNKNEYDNGQLCPPSSNCPPNN